ncbi:MAG: undecaprenyl-diphosphatase UppP [Deltaproteobacteria bacterium]|nr:undecaprenyl-diphosphatase UppP [Deltaproteobacteria bacterium]
MTLVEATILGIVQGATEYLPVSSSGHLVLVPTLLGFKKAPFVFDILVQMGTLLGVILYFFSDLKQVATAMVQGVLNKTPLADPMARMGWLVGVSTIPAAVLGLLLHDFFEETFQSPRIALWFLMLTAVFLVVGERFSRQPDAEPPPRGTDSLTLKDSVVIGLSQALALFPGVSRSGSTISAGMMLGMTREAAARYSFLMSIPVMVGAGVLALKKLIADPQALSEHGAAIGVGFLTSAITGYICIRWFLSFLKRKSLLWFAGYCLVVSVGGLLLLPAQSNAQGHSNTTSRAPNVEKTSDNSKKIATGPTNKGDEKNVSDLSLSAEARKEISTLLLAQASAWNHGDLDGFVLPYAEDAVFISPTGLTKSQAAILERYQKKYGRAKETMGSLSLEVLEIRGSGRAASVVMKWQLFWPEQKDKAPAAGLSLITLLKTKSGWRIGQDASM